MEEKKIKSEPEPFFEMPNIPKINGNDNMKNALNDEFEMPDFPF